MKLFDFWQQTMDYLTREGLLLCSLGTDGTPNVMTIGRMLAGANWSKPVLAVFVRPSRATYERLNGIREFTINVLPAAFAQAIQYCGTASGRDCNKFSETGLKAVPAQRVRVPIIEQGVVHYECRVVDISDVIPTSLAVEIRTSDYPKGDYHRIYFGEVLAAYAAADAWEKLRRE